VPVLRNLLADPNDAVRLRAAVSLLRLDEEPGPAAVCEWLTSGDRWKRQRAVNEMRLAGAKAKPRSVRAAIAAIAADAQEPEGTRQAAAALLE
jgi:HEAT repeat protein